MNTPRDWASQWAHDIYFDWHGENTQDLIDAIAAALRVQPGHVRDDKGVDRKVLGQLAITADDCVVGMGATVWNGPHLGGNILPHIVHHDGVTWGNAYAPCMQISCGWDKCYSTDTAAEAARDAKGCV